MINRGFVISDSDCHSFDIVRTDGVVHMWKGKLTDERQSNDILSGARLIGVG